MIDVKQVLEDILEGLARFGCGMIGVYYEDQRDINRESKEDPKEQ